MKRRNFLGMGTALAGTYAMGGLGPLQAATSAPYVTVIHSDAEWRALLTSAEYAVMRDEETERPKSSPLLNEKRVGNYICKGCDLPLYPSSTKYESGTGWPSFWKPLPGAVRTKDDSSLFTTRTEVHCRRCGSHLGHVFNDGPQPTGKRHCLNGISLKFTPTV